MAVNGIFPSGGVAAGAAINSVAGGNFATGCSGLWYAPKCNPKLDTSAMNALLSEALNIVIAAGNTYDCARLDNLTLALPKVIRDKLCPMVTDDGNIAAGAKLLYCHPDGTVHKGSLNLCASTDVGTLTTQKVLACDGAGNVVKGSLPAAAAGASCTDFQTVATVPATANSLYCDNGVLKQAPAAAGLSTFALAQLSNVWNNGGVYETLIGGHIEGATYGTQVDVTINNPNTGRQGWKCQLLPGPAASEFRVVFDTPQPDTTYIVEITNSVNVLYGSNGSFTGPITNKTENGFSIWAGSGFGNASPTNACFFLRCSR